MEKLTAKQEARLPFLYFKDGESHLNFFQNFMVKTDKFEECLDTFVVRTAFDHFSEATTLFLEKPKFLSLQMGVNNDIHMIKDKLKELDENKLTK